MSRPDVVVSIGFGQIHMAPVAGYLHKQGRLLRLLAGAYPKTSGAALPVVPATRRFLERRIEGIPSGDVTSLWGAEALHQLSQIAHRKSVGGARKPNLAASSLLSYQRGAAAAISKLPEFGVYHYRSGFGGRSLPLARQRGALLVCDHSIAHPSFLAEATSKAQGTGAFWQQVVEDVDAADVVLVNSGFVKETFEQAGFPSDRVAVVYTGPDDNFSALAATETPRGWDGASPLQVLVAGTMEYRKGTDLVAQAAQLRGVDFRVQYRLVGDWDPALNHVRKDLERRSDVTLLGKLSRSDLVKEMTAADILLLPSRAEGSARVVVEAMLLGCVPIVSESAGAPVRQGENGLILGDLSAETIRVAIDACLVRGATLTTLAERAATTARSLNPNQYNVNVEQVYESAVRLG